MKGAGLFRRATLRRRTVAHGRKLAQALADRAANQATLSALLQQIEAIDVQLAAVDQFFTPRKQRTKTQAADARH